MAPFLYIQGGLEGLFDFFDSPPPPPPGQALPPANSRHTKQFLSRARGL